MRPVYDVPFGLQYILAIFPCEKDLPSMKKNRVASLQTDALKNFPSSILKWSFSVFQQNLKLKFGEIY